MQVKKNALSSLFEIFFASVLAAVVPLLSFMLPHNHGTLLLMCFFTMLFVAFVIWQNITALSDWWRVGQVIAVCGSVYFGFTGFGIA
jgi:hypothetical protein